LEEGDLLFCAETINIWPPYSRVKIIGDYFQLQLIGLDGTTVLAATPMTAWENAPQSIYLSAASATPITWSAAYRIRIQATFSATVNDDYILTSADWKGSDLIWLDEWMMATAYSMNEYYDLVGDNTLTQQIAGTGEVFTDSGGAFFTNGIPGIAQVRPDKFLTVKSKTDFDRGVANNTYDKAPGAVGDYEDKLGTEIAGDLDTWGDLFSMDGNNFGGLLVAVAVALVVIIGLILGGRAAIPLFVVGGVPLIFIGNYIQVVGIQWTLVLGIIMYIFFVRAFWWKST
jgi:hypothetical protein